MTLVQKLKSFCYLVALWYSVFYIVSNSIPPDHKKIMWNNLVGQETDDLDPQGGGENFPEGEGAGVQQLGPFQAQNIVECQCSRKWMYPPSLDSNGISQSIKTGSYLRRFNSSCSDEGTYYQTGQNVISFSMFYPPNPPKLIPSPHNTPLNYQVGLLRNLLKMRQNYPDYSLRVYTSVSLLPRGYFCDLLCHNKDLFWCNIRKTPSHGDLHRMNFRTWRFLPLGDPTVNIFHSRDLDSLIGHREAAASQDWLSNSPSSKDQKAIMVMRDRRSGHNIPMLAGMWGADNSKLIGQSDKLQKLLISMSQRSKAQGKNDDQRILNSVIFYPMAKDILAYDSYNCVKWSNFTEVRPFPVQRGDPTTDFVGNRVNFTGDGKKWTCVKVECPLECRPSYGLDWIYC